MKQQKLLKDFPKAYGGDLFKTRRGRSQPRPIVVKQTMHLVLRSTLAKGKWSFLEEKNKKAIKEILNKFAVKYGVRLLHGANVGNHIHLEIQLTNRNTYRPFIRAVTAAIAMKITGVSRWKSKADVGIKRFWDQRPFTRVVIERKSRLTLKDYIAVNRMEGRGIARQKAVRLIRKPIYFSG